MTIRTFWTLLLKLLGIYFILSSLSVISFFISFFSFHENYGGSNILEIIFVSILVILTIAVYLIVLKMLVFNPGWIIDKLKLDKGFQEERIDLNISYRTVLTIAVIVVGALIFVESFPLFCKYVFSTFQRKLGFREDPEFGNVIIYFVSSVIGYLIVTNSNYIVDFIQKKTKNIED